jgi:predicted GIY-YIG superfamily endonuclease
LCNGSTPAFCAKGALAFGEGDIEDIMKCYVYVLKSSKNGIRYVGSGNNPLERLRRHNKGDIRFTKGHRPWELIYKEEHCNRSEAMKREQFLKSGQGRKFLDGIEGETAESSPDSNLR